MGNIIVRLAIGCGSLIGTSALIAILHSGVKEKPRKRRKFIKDCTTGCVYDTETLDLWSGNEELLKKFNKLEHTSNEKVFPDLDEKAELKLQRKIVQKNIKENRKFAEEALSGKHDKLREISWISHKD